MNDPDRPDTSVTSPHKGRHKTHAREDVETDVDKVARIQSEVGVWSKMNFGNQVSKRTNFPLGSVAPLLGLAEELTEMLTATTREESEDAVGDVLLYLLDLSNRDDYDVYIAWHPSSRPDSAIQTVIRGIGLLTHAHLKAHQGIRGYGDESFYKEKREIAYRTIFCGLHAIADKDLAKPLIVILQETWARVQQRDWVADPDNAGTTATN